VPHTPSINERQATSALIAWMRADLLLQLFDHYTEKRIEEFGKNPPDVTMIKDNDGICLYLWQACLSIVLKFLDDRHFLPETIKKDYDPIAYQLNGFRDCVFHVQDTYMTERQNELFKLSDNQTDVIAITRGLHRSVGEFLKSTLSGAASG